MDKLTTMFKRAKQIYKAEGFVSLVRRGFAFVLWLFFDCRTYYLYRYMLDNNRRLSEAHLKPKIDNILLRVVTTNREADEMEAEGLEFRSQVYNARQRLDGGAVAFCIFIRNELAHIGWVAITQRAKDILGEPPYAVDFSNGEACGASLWTNPKYRRMGLRVYGAFKRRQFMLDRGKLIDKSAVSKRNAVSQMGSARIGSQAYAEGRYLKILWWKSWKETPLTQG
jgi:hypothetical protein